MENKTSEIVVSEFATPKMTYGDALRFTVYAYAKLLWMRDRGNTEVAGYATTGTNDPLLITDFRLIKQECTCVTFDLDTDDLAEDAERTLDMGLAPHQTLNILCHSHPSNCPQPSGTDEQNFEKAFSHPDWAIMLIIAQDGSTYCRLKINVGPGVEKLLKVEIDFSQEFQASDHKSWNEEYLAKVTKKKFMMTGKEGATAKKATHPHNADDWAQRLYSDKEIEEWDMLKEDERVRQRDEFDPQDNIWDEFDQQELDDTWDEPCWDTNGNVIWWDEDSEIWYSYDPLTRRWYAESQNNDSQEIETPKEQWAAKMVEWAQKYADERIPPVKVLL